MSSKILLVALSAAVAGLSACHSSAVSTPEPAVHGAAAGELATRAASAATPATSAAKKAKAVSKPARPTTETIRQPNTVISTETIVS